MSRRQNYEVPGISHGKNPIPMATRVGNAFHTSAVMGRDPATGELPADGAKQVKCVFANVKTLLELAGVELDQVLFFDVLLADGELRAEVNKYWLDWFPNDGDRPARHTTIRPLPNNMQIQVLVQAQLDG
jgi:2-iminobutanoate/2-iminopropanoate deaminase